MSVKNKRITLIIDNNNSSYIIKTQPPPYSISKPMSPYSSAPLFLKEYHVKPQVKKKDR